MPREDIRRGVQNARGLLNSPRLQQVLEDLDENPDELEEAKRDPQGYLRRKGVEIPGNPTRVVIEEGSIRIGICWEDWCIWFEF